MDAQPVEQRIDKVAASPPRDLMAYWTHGVKGIQEENPPRIDVARVAVRRADSASPSAPARSPYRRRETFGIIIVGSIRVISMG